SRWDGLSLLRFRDDLVLDQPEEDAVHPRLVAPVGPAPHSFAHPAGALRVTEPALVEAVELHLEAMEATLGEEVPLQCPRRGKADASALPRRVDRNAPDRRDTRA